MRVPPQAGVLLPVMRTIHGYAFGCTVSPPTMRVSCLRLLFKLDIPQTLNDKAILSYICPVNVAFVGEINIG